MMSKRLAAPSLWFAAITLLLLSSLFMSSTVFGYSYGYNYETPTEEEGEEEEEEEVDGDTHKKYKHYQKKYKNENAKGSYKIVKNWKKSDNPDEQALYLTLRAHYTTYKHFSKNERRDLFTDKQYAEFEAYRNYKGYKRYKQLRKKLGRD